MENANGSRRCELRTAASAANSEEKIMTKTTNPSTKSWTERSGLAVRVGSMLSVLALVAVVASGPTAAGMAEMGAAPTASATTATATTPFEYFPAQYELNAPEAAGEAAPTF